MSNMNYIIMIAIMVAVTAGLRFLPFILFSGSRKTPAYIEYLGKVLPYAIMGMLIVYCLKGVSITEGSHGIPELISIGLVVGLQVWKRNTLVSILAGTICYMLIVQGALIV